MTEEQKLEAYLAPIRASNLKWPEVKEKKRMKEAIEFDLAQSKFPREARLQTFESLGYIYG